MNTNSSNQSDSGGEKNASVSMMVDIRKLSNEQFAQLGLAKLAYVKPVVVNGTAGFAIHAADGTPMALAGELDVAVAAIVQHEMLPALVH